MAPLLLPSSLLQVMLMNSTEMMKRGIEYWVRCLEFAWTIMVHVIKYTMGKIVISAFTFITSFIWAFVPTTTDQRPSS